MAVDFSAFKESLNEKQIEKMEQDYKQDQGNGSFPELPSGVYPVVLDKMEVAKSQWGTDQVNITFKIVDGDHKGKLIFYNGTFDTHFAHGYSQTARLLSEMTDGDLDENSILYNLTKSVDEAANYITDLYQALAEQFEYDLDYTVKESTKLNPNTNKPYINKFYSIVEVFDM